MERGAITSYIDVAQVALYVFWAFFAGLIFYLRREDKREGYPLVSDRSGSITVVGFPTLPKPKVFHLADGSTRVAPRVEPVVAPTGVQPSIFPGHPLDFTGNPMLDGIGAASYVNRPDVPEMTFEGHPVLVPLRAAPAFSIDAEDPDPRGMQVVGADGVLAGVVADVWIDQAEVLVRYLEVALTGAHHVLVPMTLVAISAGRRLVTVNSILGAQFADIPVLKHPDQITMLEEDRICGYVGGGNVYATVQRTEPLV